MAEVCLYNLEVDGLYHGGRYKVVAKIGAGSTSTVWAVKDLQPDFGRHTLAIKVLDSTYASSERTILSYLKDFDPEHRGYDYVLKLYNSFEIVEGDKTYVCLVVDLVGPRLDRLREESGGVLSIRTAKPYFKQLLLGLEYAHAADVCHTDIKMDNILLDVTSKYKDICLIDWGEGILTSNISTRLTVQPEGLRAPEVLLSARPVWNTAMDIWNFGALLFEAVEKRHMFSGRNGDGTYVPEMHLQEIVNLLGPLPQSLLDQAAPETVGMLEFDLDGRVDLDVGLIYNPAGTPEGTELRNFLMEVMVIDPAKRPTAKELLDNDWFIAD